MSNTLNIKQSQFLTGYVMMELQNEVTDKLKELRETDEWSKAIKEGRQDATVLKRIQERKENYEKNIKLNELKQQIEALGKYTVAHNDTGRDYDLEKVCLCIPEDIDKSVSEYTENVVISYAENKTGFIQYFCTWCNEYNKLHTEVRARLAITNLNNFDEIVEATIARFDTDEIVQNLVDNAKNNFTVD